MSDPYNGLSADPNVPGITGKNTAAGNGMVGSSQGNDGVLGITFTSAHAGVAGKNDHGGPGVVGISAQSNGVVGRSTNGTGVVGSSDTGEGVRGVSYSEHGGVVGVNVSEKSEIISIQTYYIKEYIISHHLKRGDPLPSEGEIAGQLAASRNAVREAVKSLQALGIVETRHGQGTFVGDFSLNALVAGLTFRIRLAANQDLRTVRELLEIRQVLECGLVARLPGLVTASHLAELHVLVNSMEDRAAQGEPFPEEDRAFHEVLYRPLDNSLVIQLLQAFWEIYHVVGPELPVAAEHPSVTAAEHRRILEALEANDETAAVAAMAAHFAGLQGRIAELQHSKEI